MVLTDGAFPCPTQTQGCNEITTKEGGTVTSQHMEDAVFKAGCATATEAHCSMVVFITFFCFVLR